jgi:hypothetical protein
LLEQGHAVRITTRTEAGRAAIEAVGAECWIGTPERLATLRGALDAVAICCWLLGTAVGPEEELRGLHGARLEFFLTQVIDSTVRGFVYEASGTSVPADALAAGRGRVLALGELNAIPTAFVTARPEPVSSWVAQAREAIETLLSGA